MSHTCRFYNDVIFVQLSIFFQMTSFGSFFHFGLHPAMFGCYWEWGYTLCPVYVVVPFFTDLNLSTFFSVLSDSPSAISQTNG